MTKDPAGALRDGLALALWSIDELWVAMFGLGGNLTLPALDGIMTGSMLPSEVEYLLLRVALNEQLDDLAVGPSVAPWAQLPDRAA